MTRAWMSRPIGMPCDVRPSEVSARRPHASMACDSGGKRVTKLAAEWRRLPLTRLRDQRLRRDGE